VSAPVRLPGRCWYPTTRYGLFLFSPLDGGIIDGVDMGTGILDDAAAFGLRAFVVSNGGSLVQVQVAGPVRKESSSGMHPPF